MSRLEEWGTAVALSLASGAAAQTITRATITEPFRQAVKERSPWFGRLVSCPYCTSHWLAAAAVCLMQPQLTDRRSRFLNAGVSWLAVTGMSMVTAGRINESIKP
jgi:Protein of unknown function (DUF1360)